MGTDAERIADLERRVGELESYIEATKALLRDKAQIIDRAEKLEGDEILMNLDLKRFYREGKYRGHHRGE